MQRTMRSILGLALAIGGTACNSGGGDDCPDGGVCPDGGMIILPAGGAGGDGVGGEGGAGGGGQGGMGGGEGGAGGGQGGAGGGGQGGAGGGGQGGAGGGGEGGAGGGEMPLDCGPDGWLDGPGQWRLPFALDDESSFGGRSHGVIDLDGDGVLDFVVPNTDRFDTLDDPLVGRAYWLVWPGAADGWTGEPVQWRIPFTLEGVGSALGTRVHALVDLTGDGLVDFVQVREGAETPSDPLLGKAYWLVYPNTGDGFAMQPMQWRLPFSLNEERDARDIATRAHALLDLDGDGRPDFVANRDEEMPEPDALLGKAFWRVYRNTGDGFASEGDQWRLPFSLDEDRDVSDLGTQDHALLDLDGDGRPDFVAFRDEEMPDTDPLLGKAYWAVFANTGDGFAADADSWRLPFSLNEDRNYSMAATQRHALLDLDGDGRVDFVVNQNGEAPEDDPLIGRAYWAWYPNDGAGFANSAEEWRLPFALDDDSSLGTRWHAISTLAGGCLEFVLMQDGLAPEADPLVSRAYWSIWR